MAEPVRSGRRWLGPLLLLALIGLHGGVNAAWIAEDQTLRANDMGPHLAGALCAVHLVWREGAAGLATVARGREPVRWPAAAYLPVVPLALTFGWEVPRLRLYSLGALALLLIAVFVIGRKLHSPAAGLLAAAILSLYPAVYGESRMFQLDLPGAAMCALVLALLPGRGLGSPARALGVGLALGGAILVRPQSTLVLALPLCWSALSALVRPPAGQPRSRQLLATAVVVLAAAGLSAVWWWGRLGLVAEAFWTHQRGHGFAAEGSSPAFYLIEALPRALSPLWLGVFFVAAALLLARRLWPRKSAAPPTDGADDAAAGDPPGPSASAQRRGSGSRRGSAVLLWVWLLGGLALLSTLQVHMLRYLLPVLAPLALLSALGLLARSSHQPSAAAADSTASSRPSPCGRPRRTASATAAASGARSANLRHSPPPRDEVGEKSGLALPRVALRRGLVAVLLLVGAGLMLQRSFALSPQSGLGCPAPGPDRIHRAEPYVTAGPPAVTPLYAGLERALDLLRRRHASGREVLVRLENRDKLDDLRLPWMAVPLVLGALPGACVTERGFGVFALDPGADESFHWAPLPYPRPKVPPRHCYVIRLATAPQSAPPPAGKPLLRQRLDDPLANAGPTVLTLTQAPGCRD